MGELDLIRPVVDPAMRKPRSRCTFTRHGRAAGVIRTWTEALLPRRKWWRHWSDACRCRFRPRWSLWRFVRVRRNDSKPIARGTKVACLRATPATSRLVRCTI